jgi:phosphopantetheine adenylyltransferase
MEESMNKVIENFTYRMSHYEQYLQKNKSDYRSILEEAKEITGYNQFNKDN